VQIAGFFKDLHLRKECWERGATPTFVTIRQHSFSTVFVEQSQPSLSISRHKQGAAINAGEQQPRLKTRQQ
jgi:hypothetical protein